MQDFALKCFKNVKNYHRVYLMKQISPILQIFFTSGQCGMVKCWEWAVGIQRIWVWIPSKLEKSGSCSSWSIECKDYVFVVKRTEKRHRLKCMVCKGMCVGCVWYWMVCMELAQLLIIIGFVSDLQSRFCLVLINLDAFGCFLRRAFTTIVFDSRLINILEEKKSDRAWWISLEHCSSRCAVDSNIQNKILILNIRSSSKYPVFKGI